MKYTKKNDEIRKCRQSERITVLYEKNIFSGSLFQFRKRYLLLLYCSICDEGCELVGMGYCLQFRQLRYMLSFNLIL